MLSKKYPGSLKQRSLLTYTREVVAVLYQDIITEIHVEQIGMISFSITMIKVFNSFSGCNQVSDLPRFDSEKAFDLCIINFC